MHGTHQELSSWISFTIACLYVTVLWYDRRLCGNKGSLLHLHWCKGACTIMSYITKNLITSSMHICQSASAYIRPIYYYYYDIMTRWFTFLLGRPSHYHFAIYLKYICINPSTFLHVCRYLLCNHWYNIVFFIIIDPFATWISWNYFFLCERWP